jgi:BirA family biotin operon repressor/biotin-[acetyl-CoA-carboxylase] ligase
MTVYTDSPQFATTFLPSEVVDGFVPSIDARPPGDTLRHSEFVPEFQQEVEDFRGIPLGASFGELLNRAFPDQGKLHSAPFPDFPFSILLLSESSEGSQYDLLIDLARTSEPLPDRLACLAGSGSGFHGFKGRPWASPPGNIYLAVHFTPNREIPRFEVAFTILAALSVVETLDHIAGLEERARIKWVNDILLGEGKVGGVLAYTQTQGGTVSSAVLGIGLNVNTVPQVEATPFVPVVSSIRKALDTKAFGLRATVFQALSQALVSNYEILLQDGVTPLLERYRQRSLIIGEDVVICSETSDQDIEILTQGRVLALGDNLELVMEGRPDPVTGGRLVMGPYEEMIRG